MFKSYGSELYGSEIFPKNKGERFHSVGKSNLLEIFTI